MKNPNSSPFYKLTSKAVLIYLTWLGGAAFFQLPSLFFCGLIVLTELCFASRFSIWLFG